jgi:hypothetical protein
MHRKARFFPSKLRDPADHPRPSPFCRRCECVRSGGHVFSFGCVFAAAAMYSVSAVCLQRRPCVALSDSFCLFHLTAIDLISNTTVDWNIAAGGRGHRVAACTEHVDIAPTLIEAMGGVVPPAMDGVSLLPFLQHGAQPPIGWRTAGHYECVTTASPSEEHSSDIVTKQLQQRVRAIALRIFFSLPPKHSQHVQHT